MTTTITLTSAQRSALECAALDRDDEDESALLEAWDGANKLTVTDANREALLRALTEAANSEDASAEEEPAVARSARGACTALTNLYRKVRRT